MSCASPRVARRRRPSEVSSMRSPTRSPWRLRRTERSRRGEGQGCVAGPSACPPHWGSAPSSRRATAAGASYGGTQWRSASIRCRVLPDPRALWPGQSRCCQRRVRPGWQQAATSRRRPLLGRSRVHRHHLTFLIITPLLHIVLPTFLMLRRLLLLLVRSREPKPLSRRPLPRGVLPRCLAFGCRLCIKSGS